MLHNIYSAVTISGPEDDYFEGFFVQSRLVSDDTTRVGVFAATDPNSRLSSCPKETVSHSCICGMTYCLSWLGWRYPEGRNGVQKHGNGVDGSTCGYRAYSFCVSILYI